MKKVRLKPEYKKQYEEFLKIPYAERKNIIVPTCNDFMEGKIYEVIAVERGWYRIIDESGEDYIYPPEMFDVVKE